MSGCSLRSDGPASAEPAATAVLVQETAPEQPTATGGTNGGGDGPSFGGEAGDRLALAARVNGQPIFLYTYQQQVTEMVQALEAQEMASPGANGPTELGQIKERILDGLIDQLIIQQQADRLGITVSDTELEASIQAIIQKQEQDQLDTWLARNELDYDTFRDTVRSQLVAQRLFQQVTGELSLTADQIQVRYLRAPDEERARTAIGQLKAGTAFETVAQAEGLEPTRGAGELSDWFPRQLSPLPEVVTAAAFSLEPGQMNGPIQAADGFYVVKLEGKETERPLTTETFRALQQKVFADWLQEQRSAAVLERFAAF